MVEPNSRSRGLRPRPTVTMVEAQESHPRLPQYTANEVQRAIEVFQLLAKVRDRCRQKGVIDW